METLEAHITLIQSEAERLAQYLSTLSSAAWRQPSACQGWEVRDVVAHLVEVAQFYIRTISGGVHGDMAPPPELAQSGTTRAEFIAQHAITTRERLGIHFCPPFVPSMSNSTACWHSSVLGIGRNSATIRASHDAARCKSSWL